ncbi:pectate lyase [Xanthomonas campestris pv. badrii]|uniref:Pectate lyase n=1 Tax=Xanthomonas campestris pv. badrii TaxID=149696 RepID=A0A7Z2ZJK6_XANCA|nr:pectate lyase [Xanthomonas campestris]MCC4605603.1 hypothetical protein [Xanthomonas campestris pv. parthenii]QJD69705.1 pectate lyase [Xanthomonas campestris pv. badrii]
MIHLLRRPVRLLIAPALAAALVVSVPVLAAAPATGLAVMPAHAVKGWAAETVGGRGGRLIRVTTLAADGPGSFAEAVSATGPRIVVFEVGGVIDLQGESLRIGNPNLTIAGQTAPAPGITFVRGAITIATHDAIVQHIAVRPGGNDKPPRSGGVDGLTVRGHDVIIDHCSLTWATDENLSASGRRFTGDRPEQWRQGTSNRVTFSYNILAEGLRNSVHEKGEHSKGVLIHDNADGILLYGNLLDSNQERNPLIKGGARVAMVNNLIHNPGSRAIHYNLIAHEWSGRAYQRGTVSVIGNVYRAGFDTAPGLPLFTLGGVGDVQLHLRDNIAQDQHGTALPLIGRYTASARLITMRQPYLPPDVTPLPATQVEGLVYATVGARPWDRDPIDYKILSDVAENRGLIVDSEADSSGYPIRAETRRVFDEADWNMDDMSPRGGWGALTKQ